VSSGESKTKRWFSFAWMQKNESVDASLDIDCGTPDHWKFFLALQPGDDVSPLQEPAK